MGQVAVASAAQVFAHEIQQAAKLGFRLQLNNQPNSVACRLVPQSARARIIAARNAPEGSTAPVVESVAHLTDQTDRMDATREAINAALELAKDCDA